MATNTAAKSPTQFTTPGAVRLSYAHLFEPYAMEEGKEKKYSTVCLVPKKDKATIAVLTAAVEAAIAIGIPGKWNGKRPIPAKLKLPLHDGDVDKADDPNYAGMMYFTCSSSNPPGIAEKDETQGVLVKVTDKQKVYSGCWCRVSANAFPFNSNGSTGVAFGLNNVLFKKDDTPFGGGTRIDDDFADELGNDGSSEAEDPNYDPEA